MGRFAVNRQICSKQAVFANKLLFARNHIKPPLCKFTQSWQASYSLLDYNSVAVIPGGIVGYRYER